MTDRRSS